MLKQLFLFSLVLPFYLQAQSYPAKPWNYVTDEANVLSPEQEQLLNSKLKNFENSSGNQIFVYTTSSLNGNDLQLISQEIFHGWKIGSQKNDNGLLITVFTNDHKFRIHTGYGMEGTLPDLLTKKIQDQTMRPYFKENDFYTGIDKGIDELIYYSAHTYEPEEQGMFGMKYFGSFVLGYIFNVFLLILYSAFLFRKKPNKPRKPFIKGLLFFFAFLFMLIPCIGSIFLFIMLFFVIDLKSKGGSSYSGTSYYSGGDSSDYSSSDSSSDFSGGGGGDSGGGGSSSDW